MPKHSPEREQGICQQHFPASLCHAGAHGFASSLPDREWMSLNLHPLSNLAEIRQQARKPSGGAGVDTHTEHRALTAEETRQKREQLHPVVGPLLSWQFILCLVRPHSKREFVLHGLGTRSWDRACLITRNVAETSPGTSSSCQSSRAETRKVGETCPYLQISLAFPLVLLCSARIWGHFQ